MKTATMDRPSMRNCGKYVYTVTDSVSGESRTGRGDTPSAASCNCDWSTDADRDGGAAFEAAQNWQLDY